MVLATDEAGRQRVLADAEFETKWLAEVEARRAAEARIHELEELLRSKG